MTADERFGHAVHFVLKHEGGLTDNPADPGGITKFGISLRSYPELGRDGIISLTRDDAIAIYWHDWWRRYRYGEIDPLDVATKVFDFAVNMGPANGHRILQRALVEAGQTHVVVDGAIGPQTIGAANTADPGRVMQAMRHHAAEYYYRLAKRRVESRQFLFGWLNRAYA